MGAYQGGEAFLAVVDPDFQEREFWTVFTDDGGSQSSITVGVAEKNGHVAWTADVRNTTARMITVDALQPARDAGTTAYLAGRSWALFGDGWESGDLGDWSVAVP